MIISDLTPAEYDAVLQQDFATFAARCFHDLNPQAELAMNWHLEVIAAKLMDVRRSRIRRLIINKAYKIDNMAFIFHPAARGRPIASLDGAGWKCPGILRRDDLAQR